MGDFREGDMGVMGNLREGNEFTTSPRGQFNLGAIRLSVTWKVRITQALGLALIELTGDLRLFRG